MKKIFFFLQIVITSSFVFGKVAPEALFWNTSIYPIVHIIAPSKNYFKTGDDVYVKLIVSNNASYVSYVDLFLGKQFIGRDNSSPYEWCKPNSTSHVQLRNMTSGKYSISAVVKYVDSKKKVLSRKFKVKSPYAAANQYGVCMTYFPHM
ncbi:MAG: hypothetical protein IPL46_20775 [Saprospiraceae bacterium]|nr:hypothetical protein [Saprospiraceae bacterium]